MNRYSKLPARFLLVLLGTILIAAGMTSVSLATPVDTDFLGGYFDIVESTESTAYFDITRGDCDDTDENCTVKVTASPALSAATDWKEKIDTVATCDQTAGDEEERGTAFEACWAEHGRTDPQTLYHRVADHPPPRQRQLRL